MNYPKHLEEKIREEIATTYVKHEIRKLFWQLPENYFPLIDNNIDCWMQSPELAIPRDFWNGIHGIAMGFKLKIGFIYLITAENVKWERKMVSIDDLIFGVSFEKTTTDVGEGKLRAREVFDYYQKNKEAKEERKLFIKELRTRTCDRDGDPIMVTNGSVNDGNGRLADAIVNDKTEILAYVGTFTTEEKVPKNYWLPTSVIIDHLFFVYEAIRNNNEKMFDQQIEVLKYMLKDSESGMEEFKERAVISRQPDRDKIFKAIGV